MISGSLKTLIKKYPEQKVFYSLEWHNYWIMGFKIRCATTSSKIVVYYGTDPKELFETIHKHCEFDFIRKNKPNSYYSELNIMKITDIEENANDYSIKYNSSKYESTKLKKRQWYYYKGEYRPYEELASKIIDEMYDNKIFSTKEYDIGLGSRSENLIKLTCKRTEINYWHDEEEFKTHRLMKELASIYAYKITKERK